MPTIVKLNIRDSRPAEEIDLDTLTPKARALAEAIHMSFGQQPLGVLCDTGRTKGDSPNHLIIHGTGPEADRIGAQPDLRFMTNMEPIPPEGGMTGEEWVERTARSIPWDSWPVAGAESRMHPLKERVPSADAAREDRCLTRDQALQYLDDAGVAVQVQGWHLLQKAGNLPGPHHFAVNGLFPLWHVDDLDAYVHRDRELWPLSRVAEYLGYSGPSAGGSARKTLSRWGIYAASRAPGRGGESLYASDQVQAAHAHRPGQGHRTDLAT